MYVSGVRNINFSENFAYVLNELFFTLTNILEYPISGWVHLQLFQKIYFLKLYNITNTITK